MRTKKTAERGLGFSCQLLPASVVYRTPWWPAGLMVLALSRLGAASTSVSLYSGTFDGDHPAPVTVDKVTRGARLEFEVGKATALVNYPDPLNPIVAERVATEETGAEITCPWYMKLDGPPMGTRVDALYHATVMGRIYCEKEPCKDFLGRPVPESELLFGKYFLRKCIITGGKDYGFFDSWDPLGKQGVCCPEFSVERTFTEFHYFDRILIVDGPREASLTDLDIDYHRLYLTFENERGDRISCAMSDLIVAEGEIRISDARDCVLPAGDRFTLYAQSRFFSKQTKPCGRFVAKGRKIPSGKYIPDWFSGWYECDGKVDRTPIEKQYTYPTRIQLTFTPENGEDHHR